MKTNSRANFILGSDWLYFKVYTGLMMSDTILCKLIYPIVNLFYKEGVIKKFFFIRYADPYTHLRLRFLLSSRSNMQHVVDFLSNKIESLVDSHMIWKYQLDMYKREYERYNIYLIEDVESLFSIDSLYIIKLISYLDTNNIDNYRWVTSLCLLDQFLSDFGYSISSKRELMELASCSLKSEFGFKKKENILLNNKYREYRNILNCVMNRESLDNINIKYLFSIVKSRSFYMKNHIERIKLISDSNGLNIQEFVPSYIHMTMNRLFKAQNRLYELVIYDLLKRYYIQQLAFNCE